MKIKAENGSGIIAAIVTAIASVKNKEPVNYFFNILGVGFIRVRKTTAISWQLYGIGLPKKSLHERLATVEGPVKFKMFPGEYNLKMVDTLAEEGQHTITSPSKEETTGDEKEETTGDDKPFKVGKKVLEKIYKKKQIKNALVSSELWKKKQVSKILGAITFDGKNANGYDICDAIDTIQGEQPTVEEKEKLFSNL